MAYDPWTPYKRGIGTPPFLPGANPPGLGTWDIQNMPIPEAAPPRRSDVAEYLAGLRGELDEMLGGFDQPAQPLLNMPWMGKHPRAANAIEGALTMAGQIGKGGDTWGENISLLSNALLNTPSIMRDRRRAEQLQPLQELEPIMKLREAMMAQEDAAMKRRAEEADITYKGALGKQAEAAAEYQRYLASQPQKTEFPSAIPGGMHISGDKMYIPTLEGKSLVFPYGEGARPFKSTTSGGAQTAYKDHMRTSMQLWDAQNPDATELERVQAESGFNQQYQIQMAAERAASIQAATSSVKPADQQVINTVRAELSAIERTDPFDYYLQQLQVDPTVTPARALSERNAQVAKLKSWLANVAPQETGATIAPPATEAIDPVEQKIQDTLNKFMQKLQAR